MGAFTDKKIKLGQLLDTNINVFTFGSLLLNGVSGFGGVKKYSKKKASSSSSFVKKSASASTNLRKVTPNG
jgi:hypothetical protein